MIDIEHWLCRFVAVGFHPCDDSSVDIRDPDYLDQKLLPFIKNGGYIYIAVPGMKKDCHDNLPKVPTAIRPLSASL